MVLKLKSYAFVFYAHNVHEYKKNIQGSYFYLKNRSKSFSNTMNINYNRWRKLLLIALGIAVGSKRNFPFELFIMIEKSWRLLKWASCLVVNMFSQLYITYMYLL